MKKLGSVCAVTVLILALAVPALAQSGYGRAVAVGDVEVFIGEAGNRISSGFVYVYRPSAGGWKEVGKLRASDAVDADGFGGALAVDGDLLLVGGGEGNGTVYVFAKDGDEWTEVGTLNADDGVDGDAFGSAIDMSDDFVIVGATGHNERQGAAYIFRRSGSSWAQVAKLEATNPTEEEQQATGGRRGGRGQGGSGGQGGGGGRRGGRNLSFGSAVAIDGDWAMVSAPNYSGRSGSVYAFHRDGGNWEQVAQLPGDNAQQGAAFGGTINLNGGEMFIGASDANVGIGGVAIYGLDDDGTWVSTGNLVPFDGQRGGGFGSSLVVDDDRVYIGAPEAGGGEGRIYVYERDDAGGNWTSATKMGAGNLAAGDSFATALAGNGDIMVASQPGDDFRAGTATVLTRTDYGWSGTKIFSGIANYEMVTGGDGLECSNGMAGDFPCDNVDLVSFMPVHEIGGVRGLRTNDAWGWTDTETGRDYAIIGMTDRASFVDVTDPYNPVHVGILMMTEGARPSSWRDMKVRNDWVYIVSDGSGEHGIQIFDLTHLREFDGEPVDFKEDAHYGGVGSTHNIVINPETDFAYAVGADGPNGCGGGLHIVNIEDPTNPTFEGCFQDMNTGRRGTGSSHDAMCVTYDGPDDRYADHEICIGSNETALSIADVSDKRNPVALGMATYPNVAYSHQGWITEDHAYFFMNDELDEGRGLVDGTRTLIWDIQDLEDPILVREYVADNPATDHNLYIVGDTMYQSNYDSGLRVYDISDPENPEPLGFMDTVPYSEGGGMTGSWSNYPFFESGVIVVTSGSEGMLIVKVRN